MDCQGCGVCSSCCPSMLCPSEAIRSIAEGSGRRGITQGEAKLRTAHPDRLGRRQSVDRLTERLGLGIFSSEVRIRRGQIIPDRIFLPLWSESGSARVPMVRLHEEVNAGDLLALAPAESQELDLRAPVSGRVMRVDPDHGLTIQVR
jgi:Na+-translocating ferredoxin:NAD+ oxidoreductase RnfC subunit